MPGRVSIVGAGHVGATTAQLLAQRGLADVVLLDVQEGLAAGKALDLQQMAPLTGSDVRLSGSSNAVATQGSSVVVVTAGLARKPGMSRDELLYKNAGIVRQVVLETVKYSPDAIHIIVTNPLDAMTQVALRASGLSRNRVVGMAGMLDSARFATFIASELGVSMKDVHASVLGGHGDLMVPLPRYSTVAGVAITELLSREQIARIVERTRHGGAEIVKLLQTGSAYYAPGAAITEMIESILLDRRRILPCCTYLEGEYGHAGVCAGVPVVLGRKGVERVFELDLDAAEAEALDTSIAAVRGLVEELGVG